MLTTSYMQVDHGPGMSRNLTELCRTTSNLRNFLRDNKTGLFLILVQIKFVEFREEEVPLPPKEQKLPSTLKNLLMVYLLVPMIRLTAEYSFMF